MPLRTLVLIVLCLGFACVGRAVGAATANEPPSADDVEQIIANTLPGYWRVDQLSLSDPVDYGNPVEPEWRWRYEALIAPKEPLYVDGGRHEEVVLLKLSLGPESAQTLYGVAVATFQAGVWSGEARHENRPFDHGGEPASFFPGRTVVVGSPEERELREATWQRELEELEARHKAKVAASKIEHQGELAAAKEAHRAALERLKADLEAERARREAEYESELAVRLAAVEADLKAEAQQRRVEITESEKLTELSAEARDRVDALEAAETQMLAAARDRLTALQAGEADMLAASERFHEARRVALKKLFDTLGVVTSPDEYIALLDTASESELDWMRVVVLRHGLGSDDLALNRAAWRNLLQADTNSDPELRSLLADHIQALSAHPESRRIVKDALPSISQWASEVVNFSSQYHKADFHATQVLGKPNMPSCKKASFAWAPSKENNGIEFIRVRFSESVWFPEIGVHETQKLGFVRKIVLWDAEGQGTEYDVQDPLAGEEKCRGTARFRIDEHTKPVNEVSVVLDTKAVSGWNEIDAISLTGSVLAVK